MGREPGSHGGAGEAPSADPRLPGFASGGEWDACRPSAGLAAAVEAASGPEWRCPGATRDEMVGLLRQWQALESWAAAGKLGVLRALVRDEAQPLPGGGYQGDLPEGWTRSLTHEVALALSMPAASAERLMWLAWNLQALLPGTGELLATGELTLAKARAVDTALNLLSPEDAARAEALIVPELPGKTYGQVQQLAVQAALTADPQVGTRRRQDAERHKARVHLFREETGAAGLSGRDLPTDQALTAHASVCARAEEYKDSGAFLDGTRMDQIRDGHCTFPPCSRHARESDFEHALPYDKGGRTGACNAGARSRACHQVKQSPGWNVTQPRPGWHQWTTPTGRSYTQDPKRYPV